MTTTEALNDRQLDIWQALFRQAFDIPAIVNNDNANDEIIAILTACALTEAGYGNAAQAPVHVATPTRRDARLILDALRTAGALGDLDVLWLPHVGQGCDIEGVAARVQRLAGCGPEVAMPIIRYAIEKVEAAGRTFTPQIAAA